MFVFKVTMIGIEKFHNVMYFMGKYSGDSRGHSRGTPWGTLEIYKVNPGGTPGGIPGGTPGETRLTLEIKRTDAWQQCVYLEMI